MKGNTRALQKQDLRPISLGATTLARCDEFGGATTLARPQSLARQGEARARQGEARGRGAALSFTDASEEGSGACGAWSDGAMRSVRCGGLCGLQTLLFAVRVATASDAIRISVSITSISFIAESAEGSRGDGI